MNGRSQKLDTHIRQEQIAQAALQLVSQYGLAHLNLARVAEQVGLVQSAIYRHFPNKEAVIQAILDLIRDRLLGNIRRVRQETAEPLEQLHRLLQRHIALVRENRGIPGVVFSEDLLHDHPERKAKIYHTIRLYLSRVADILRQGQEQGRIRGDLDADSLAIMFLGLVQPAVILYHMSDGDFDLSRQVNQAWQVFREVIANPKKDVF